MSNIRDQLEQAYKRGCLEQKVRMILPSGEVVEKTLPRDKLHWLEDYVYDEKEDVYDLSKPKERAKK